MRLDELVHETIEAMRPHADAGRVQVRAELGLAIAKAIVTAHGGRIWLVQSGSGTRIRFSLPAA